MRLEATIASFLFSLVVAACAVVGGPAQSSTVFLCPDGTLLDATFIGQERVRVQVEERTYVLPRLISASGARYGSGPVVFWTQGREATLYRRDGSSHGTCLATP